MYPACTSAASTAFLAAASTIAIPAVPELPDTLVNPHTPLQGGVGGSIPPASIPLRLRLKYNPSAPRGAFPVVEPSPCTARRPRLRSRVVGATRPPVPAHIKRELRQQARFGCCICGLPIYQYHHIVPWEVEQHFRSEDMMILCPTHHDEATKGALEEAEQRRYRLAPHNATQGYTEGLLKVNQRHCAVDVGGGVLLVGNGVWIEVDEEPLLALEVSSEGTLLLSANLYDAADNAVATIEENEWIAGDAPTWDMELDWQRLTLRLGPNRVALRINAKGEPMTLRGVLWHRGHRFNFKGTGLEVSGRCTFENLGLVRMGLRLDSCSGELRWGPRPGEAGVLVSEPDPVRRLLKALKRSMALNSTSTRIGRPSTGTALWSHGPRAPISTWTSTTHSTLLSSVSAFQAGNMKEHSPPAAGSVPSFIASLGRWAPSLSRWTTPQRPKGRRSGARGQCRRALEQRDRAMSISC